MWGRRLIIVNDYLIQPVEDEDDVCYDEEYDEELELILDIEDEFPDVLPNEFDNLCSSLKTTIPSCEVNPKSQDDHVTKLPIVVMDFENDDGWISDGSGDSQMTRNGTIPVLFY